MKFNGVKFIKGKLNRKNFRVLHLKRNNPRHPYVLCTIQRECCLTEKDLGFQQVTKLNMKHQCSLFLKQANGILDYNRQSKSREMVFALFLAPVKPHLESCAHFCTFQ